MNLQDLLSYDHIMIQCHDNPDADAIAAGFGIYSYLKLHGKAVELFYSGAREIQKANLLLMVQTLSIPLKYMKKEAATEFVQTQSVTLLVTVDCQYGEGNVTLIPAPLVAVIDHHQARPEGLTPSYSDTVRPNLCEIRSNLGSCSTLVWDMLRREQFPLEENKALCTALYYGLLTDTNRFTELSHPLDKDMRDDCTFDNSLITRYLNTNYSLQELVIAGKALIEYQYHERCRFSVVQAEPCDPNILGMISDLVLEVDVVDTCLVYSILPQGVKLSVRSCTKEVKACEMVQVITHGIGSGGGHLVKAGGFIALDRLPCDIKDLSRFFIRLLEDYFTNTEIIYARNYTALRDTMQEYEKKPLSLGYVKLTDAVPPGTPINIRTLEGDFDFTAREDVYIILGLIGEIYPIQQSKFEAGYTCTEDAYSFTADYCPTIRNSLEGSSVPLLPYARSCVSAGGNRIYAKPLDKRVKIFTAWDEDKYMSGQPGDYLAVRTDDLQDVYVIRQDIFEKSYAPV